ncbi:MAG: anhydro-N-acetylmuramic acid kinase [Pseudomonadota bacterium]
MTETLTALGLMSGTSMDGIDVALIETDGERHIVRGPSMTFPYGAEARGQISQALGHARSITSREQRPGRLPDVERVVTEHHAAAVLAFMRRRKIDRSRVDVVGFHGQTVLHRPEDGLSVQLGDASLLAELIQLPVVADLRVADLEAGGQGAPLAPIYHWASAGTLDARPLAVLNIGGVANVTFVGADTDAADGVVGGAPLPDIVAFDTGPGNALIDDWMLKKTGQNCDLDGAAAARGTVHDNVVQFYTNHDFFAKPPPKSLDRNAFYWDMMEWMETDDGAATLTAFTAEAVARACALLPETPKKWIVTGGGRRNPTLLRFLQERLTGQVLVAEDVGWDGDGVEAEAWAYLAIRSLKGLPISFPRSTGAPNAMTGGIVYPARDPLASARG